MTWTLSAFADEGGATTEAQIQGLKESGLQFIDMRTIDGYGVVDLPIEHAKVVKTKLDNAGIATQMFGSPIGKIDIDDDFSIDINRLKHLAALSPILGCNAVRIFSYYNKAQRPYSQFRDISINRLGALRDKAKELGLILYHENELNIFGDAVDNVAVIGKEVRDGKTFRTIFDFDNYTQGGQNSWDAWQKLKADVDGFHLKDSSSRQYVPVGTGDGFVEKILRDALAIGWHGPLSVEPHLLVSNAVAATGPSGTENQTYKDMPEGERFILACNAATSLLKRIQAPFA